MSVIGVMLTQRSGASNPTIHLGELTAFVPARIDVTALAGEQPIEVVAQHPLAEGYVRRAWKPSDNAGDHVDLVPGGKTGAGAITIAFPSGSRSCTFTVVDPIPGGAVILDDIASGDHDYTDWQTAVEALTPGQTLVVRARAGGGVYNLDVMSGGPTSTADNVTIMADPVDVAAGRRPRVHVMGGTFSRFAETGGEHWEADPAAGGAPVYRTTATFTAQPAISSSRWPQVVGGLVRNAGGGWTRLNVYTDTPGNPTALARMRDMAYTRGTGCYIGPGIHWGSDGRYYVRLDPIPSQLVRNPAGSTPSPYPWDWDEYQPASTDPNDVELMLSATATAGSVVLDITGSNWTIQNLDIVGGGGGIGATQDLTLQGCRFLGVQNRGGLDSKADSYGTEYTDFIAMGTGTIVVNQCEFWAGTPPWLAYWELKGARGFYGYSQRFGLWRGEPGHDITFRNCVIDGFFHLCWSGGAVDPRGSFSVRFHHCDIRRCGIDGGLVTTPADSGDVHSWLRCTHQGGSLIGYAYSGVSAPTGQFHVGSCVYQAMRPDFFAVAYHDNSESEFVGFPPRMVNSHGYTYPAPSTAIYNSTLVATNAHAQSYLPSSVSWSAGLAGPWYPAGSQGTGFQHRTHNNVAIAVQSPYRWLGTSGQAVHNNAYDAYATPLAVPAGLGFAYDVEHDHDHFHRFGSAPAGSTSDWLVSVLDSGGTWRQCDDVADIQTWSGSLFEANGTDGDPQFAVTPVWDVPDATFRQLDRWVIGSGSPAASGGNTSLTAEGWPDVDVDGSEYTYPGYAWRGALEAGVPAIEQQVGPLCPTIDA